MRVEVLEEDEDWWERERRMEQEDAAILREIERVREQVLLRACVRRGILGFVARRGILGFVARQLAPALWRGRFR